MHAKRNVTREALAQLVREFHDQAHALMDEDAARARGYAEAAMTLTYTFGIDPHATPRAEAACQLCGGALCRCPSCGRGCEGGALRGALIAAGDVLRSLAAAAPDEVTRRLRALGEQLGTLVTRSSR